MRYATINVIVVGRKRKRGKIINQVSEIIVNGGGLDEKEKKNICFNGSLTISVYL